jgi:hypothetical protein
MNILLNTISFLATITVALIVFHILIKLILSPLIKTERKIVFEKILLKDVIYITISILILISFTEIYFPY